MLKRQKSDNLGGGYPPQKNSQAGSGGLPAFPAFGKIGEYEVRNF